MHNTHQLKYFYDKNERVHTCRQLQTKAASRTAQSKIARDGEKTSHWQHTSSSTPAHLADRIELLPTATAPQYNTDNSSSRQSLNSSFTSRQVLMYGPGAHKMNR
jgi:hypothetical protein